MNRFKKWKKGIAAAAILSIAGSSITGCAGESREEVSVTGVEMETSQTEEKAMGRYLEEELAVPEGSRAVNAIKFLDSGELRILYNDANYMLYVADSDDKGSTWSEERLLGELLELDAENNIINAALAPDGGIFAVTRPTVKDDDMDNPELHFHYISPKGTSKELNVPVETAGKFVFFSRFTDNNTILFELPGDGIFEFDIDDEHLENRYEAGNSVEYFGTAGKYLAAITDGTVHYYELETGKPLDNMDALTKQITSNSYNLELASTSSLPSLFLKGAEDNNLFYLERSGLYHYTEGGASVELVIDSTLNSISSPVTGFTDLIQDEEGSFYLSALDFSGPYATGKIYKYVYDKDTPTVPETELKLYSMKENEILKQAAAVFQKENPDIYVNIQTGMTGDNSITDTDALKVLNTEIIAGKGPDILLLDSLPKDTYIEKGLLEDLSELFKDVELLDNIKAAYTEEDGRIYAMPAKFAIPMIQGPKEYVDTVTDLNTLANAAEMNVEEYSQTHLFADIVVTPEMTLETLLDVNLPAWIKKDGTLDENLLSEYLINAHRIYAPCSNIINELFTAQGISAEDLAFDYDRTFLTVTASALNTLGEHTRLGVGGLFSPEELAHVDSINKKAPELTCKLWNGQSQNVFYPEQLMGINAKSTKKEAAKNLFTSSLQKKDSNSAQGSDSL